MINFTKARKKIALLWFSVAAIIFILMLARTITGKFDDHINEAWGWFTQNLSPTLLLIISSFFTDGKDHLTEVTIDKFRFRLSFYLSLFYLLVLLTVLGVKNINVIEWLQSSNIYLGILQGIVASSIGMFFINKTSNSS
ncbi:hypothetical protein [Neptunitalea lumnitzerae]|uniref:Uncharacterized protein n=1 Tax=Neptunitalea lumnitzerae TaxID=2965509 RepID=A0ABQ5MKB4_9FLAO|nr:hypothetical protein [Neptunitalea sp. Y10]GLB49824.1 hypothetical protein Y10_21920 [Neptunitalea sp. Y10]